MPRSKARYTGDGVGEVIPDFSENLRKKLRELYPYSDAGHDTDFTHPADDFVTELLYAASWAKSELHDLKFNCTKQELRAEQSDLLKYLEKTEFRLRNISLNLDKLFDVSADPKGCSDEIRKMIVHMGSLDNKINNLPTALGRKEKEREILVEMSLQILRVLKNYDIKPLATRSAYFDYTSIAIVVLNLIGSDMNLGRYNSTWTSIIAEAKMNAPDLLG